MGSANAVLALALTALCLWARTPAPLALGAAGAMGLWVARAGVLSLPNAVTSARLLMLVCALLAAWEQPLLIAPFALAAWVLDGLDGWLARRRGQVTAFGALFDQETDAYLVLLLCVELVVARDVGRWVLIAGALRYLLVLTRSMVTGPLAERRSSWGRASFSFSYLSLVAGLLLDSGLTSTVLLGAAVGVLLFSFAPDFLAVARALGGELSAARQTARRP